MAHRWLRIRGAWPSAALALFIVALVAGCAQQGSAPAGVAAAPARPAGDVAQFNGWYQGTSVPVGASTNCRDQMRGIWFRVENGLIELRSARHRRSAVATAILAGTLSADGQVALRGGTSEGFAVGQIAGGHLTVEDVSAVVVRDGHNACQHRYEAHFHERLRK